MKILKRIFKVLKWGLVTLAFVGVVAGGVLSQYNFQDHHPKIETWLKTNHNLDIDLVGETKIGWHKFGPSIKVQGLRYGAPAEFSAAGVEIGLVNIVSAVRAARKAEKVEGIQVDLYAREMLAGQTQLSRLNMPLEVSENLKTYKPMTAGLYGGQLRSDVEILGSKLFVNGTIDDVPVSNFNPNLDFDLDTSVTISARLGDIFIQTLNGNVTFRSDGGYLAGQALNVWGGDVLVNLLPGGKKNTELVCLVAPFKIENGIMHTDGVIINTGRVVVLGKGWIDLNAQTIDFVFKPKPKGASLLNLSTPIAVKGDLADPYVSVRAKDIAKKLGGVLASAINPAALVLTFSKLGSDIQDDACFKQSQGETDGE